MKQRIQKVGKTTARVLKRAAKISNSAVKAAIGAAKENSDSAESEKATSNTGGTNPKRELQVIPLKPVLEEPKQEPKEIGKVPAQRNTELIKGNPKNAKIILVEENDHGDCDIAYEIGPEDAKQVRNLCFDGELIFENNPEHPLYRERHKWKYRAYQFRQRHPEFVLTGKKIRNTCHGLLRMSGVAAVLACACVGLIFFFKTKIEFDVDGGYRALALTNDMGTTNGADISPEDIWLNSDVYSEFPSYLQITPITIFGHEKSSQSVTGRNFFYTQPCYIGFEEGFAVDFWVCLPKGRTNDSLCVVYPEQLSQDDNRSLQFFLVNSRQYRNALLEYIIDHATYDEQLEMVDQLSELSDVTSGQIVNFIEGKTIGGERYDNDKTRQETWRVALDTRSLLSQISLDTNRGCVDLIRESYTEVLEEFDNIEYCLEQQSQGKIPQNLSIADSTAKILHYQTKFNATNADFHAKYDGNGIYGNTKFGIFAYCFVACFVVLAILTILDEIKWVKPIETAEEKADNSAENRDVAN